MSITITFDENKSLEELEDMIWGKPSEDFRLVAKCHLLRKKAIGDFNVEELRLLIGQKIGLDYLVPIAINIIEECPLAQGNYYPGDLLNSVLGIDKEFWVRNPICKDALVTILKDTIDLFGNQLSKLEGK